MLKENLGKIREVFDGKVEIDLNILEELPLKKDLEEQNGVSVYGLASYKEVRWL